jgi:hypothetical protein
MAGRCVWLPLLYSVLFVAGVFFVSHSHLSSIAFVVFVFFVVGSRFPPQQQRILQASRELKKYLFLST